MAGMVNLQCNNCVIHTQALQRRASHNGALYKSSFLFDLPTYRVVVFLEKWTNFDQMAFLAAQW